MGAGGIVQQRAKTLLQAITEPCLFDSLPDHCKQAINVIDAKAPDQRTEHDVHVLAALFPVAVTC